MILKSIKPIPKQHAVHIMPPGVPDDRDQWIASVQTHINDLTECLRSLQDAVEQLQEFHSEGATRHVSEKKSEQVSKKAPSKYSDGN